MKIVSLVPSLTELLFNLDLEDQIVGRTKFCIHPGEKVKSIPKIGGTKNVNIQKVLELNPNLIIANKEENTKSDIELLQKSCNVHVTEISNFKQAIFTIDDIGLLTNTADKATSLIEEIESAFKKIDTLVEDIYNLFEPENDIEISEEEVDKHLDSFTKSIKETMKNILNEKPRSRPRRVLYTEYRTALPATGPLPQ